MSLVSTAKALTPEQIEPSTASSRTVLNQFCGDDRGNVAILFALTTMLVCSVVGGAVDYGRWLSARSQTQNAIDSALLAAGRTAQTTYGDATASVAAANAYYAQMKSDIVVSDTIAFQSVNTATSFNATGTAYVNTPFLSLVGITKLPVLATTGVTQATSTIAQGGNSGSSVEIGLMLDTTGSMSGQKLTDLKAAATDLVDIVVWADQGTYTSRIGIAPFANAVNVGSYFQAVTNLNPAAHTEMITGITGYSYPSSCYNSKGQLKSSCNGNVAYAVYGPVSTNVAAKATCVVERSGTDEFTDTVPSGTSWIPSWNVISGSSSTTCPEVSEIVPLTSDKTKLKNTINGLVAQNTTAGALGTAWAWYLISPNWNTIFTGTSAPSSYSQLTELGTGGQPKLQKIAILMTDGAYNTWQYNSGVAVSTVSTKAKSVCTAMKAKGIKVYTIGFDLQGDADAISTLSNCATDSTYFYNAATGDQLKQAFRDIALKISALRISH